MAMKGKTRIRGFTLTEILVVIAIVAILVALAVPNYQASVRKSRRADAQADLIEFANTAERIFTQTNSYASTDADGDGTPNEVIADTDYYTYTFSVNPTATAWTVTATPTAIQTADPCGTMSLAHTGQRTKTGSLADCW
jgi:type IV pilus assembly protein PilE